MMQVAHSDGVRFGLSGLLDVQKTTPVTVLQQEYWSPVRQVGV